MGKKFLLRVNLEQVSALGLESRRVDKTSLNGQLLSNNRSESVCTFSTLGTSCNKGEITWSQKNSSKKEQAEQMLITRVFDAPRDFVWKAWTECEHLMRWWGPKGFTTPFCKIDLRVGGVYHNCMRPPEGKDYWSTGVYREIVPLRRIVCTDSFADEEGNIVPATHYGMSADFPLEMLVTVTFEEIERKTKLTLQHALGSVPASERDLCQQGWSESLDKLSGELAKA
jgi:uncharacterized protein YndB with AHSA1/START domain